MAARGGLAPMDLGRRPVAPVTGRTRHVDSDRGRCVTRTRLARPTVTDRWITGSSLVVRPRVRSWSATFRAGTGEVAAFPGFARVCFCVDGHNSVETVLLTRRHVASLYLVPVVHLQVLGVVDGQLVQHRARGPSSVRNGWRRKIVAASRRQTPVIDPTSLSTSVGRLLTKRSLRCPRHRSICWRRRTYRRAHAIASLRAGRSELEPADGGLLAR